MGVSRVLAGPRGTVLELYLRTGGGAQPSPTPPPSAVGPQISGFFVTQWNRPRRQGYSIHDGAMMAHHSRAIYRYSALPRSLGFALPALRACAPFHGQEFPSYPLNEVKRLTSAFVRLWGNKLCDASCIILGTSGIDLAGRGAPGVPGVPQRGVPDLATLDHVAGAKWHDPTLSRARSRSAWDQRCFSGGFRTIITVDLRTHTSR